MVKFNHRANKILLWLAAVIMEVGLASGIFYSYFKQNQSPPPQEHGQISAAAAQITNEGKKNQGVSRKSPSPTPFTYQKTVESYTGYRVQFNNQCQAIPAAGIVYKTGTRVMFDNRSQEPKTISVDGKKYLVGPYGFIVLSLSSKTLPYTVRVDCGTQYNTANLLLEN